MLLVVADSIGSSPGRAGYKMAVASEGAISGSIGGGVMEVSLVERAKAALASAEPLSNGSVVEQVHRKNVPNSSGMICSGRQAVIVKPLSTTDLDSVDAIIRSLHQDDEITFEISNLKFQIIKTDDANRRFSFSKTDESAFAYREKLGGENDLFIIGGGHCALALSELAVKVGFRVSIFDDRPELNTIEKNKFADSVSIIDSYENIAAHIPDRNDIYVVVMTLGYRFDKIVIERLIDREFKYFGVLGSKAKMAALLKELRSGGISSESLSRLKTPIGLPINSRTPDEIAVSIAAEMIATKNRDDDRERKNS